MSKLNSENKKEFYELVSDQEEHEPFLCEICEESHFYSTKKSLLKHVKTVHRGKNSKNRFFLNTVKNYKCETVKVRCKVENCNKIMDIKNIMCHLDSHIIPKFRKMKVDLQKIEDIKEESGSFYKNFEKYCKSEDCGRPLATSTIKWYKNLLKKFADFSKISLQELENDVQR